MPSTGVIRRSAAEQHNAVVEFLSRDGIKEKLKDRLQGLGEERVFTELNLLNMLLKSAYPVRYEDINKKKKYEEVQQNRVTAISKKLRDQLEKYSHDFDVLNRDSVVITIYKQRGGRFVGYYLTCQDSETLDYITDPDRIRLLLSDAYGVKVHQSNEAKCDLKYLQPIEEVLKINRNEEAKWFRKTGPLAVDFDTDKVYCRRKLLDKLKNMVMSNLISILEGVAATGKSVLIRQLAYELRKDDKLKVFYFDCDLERDFDLSELAKECNSVEGIIIFENIHLQTTKLQRICDRIVDHKTKHILLVTRPSFKDNEYSKDFTLSSLPRFTLKPFEDVDEIIKHFIASNDLVDISEEIVKEIKEITHGNFWLLSYALKGYKDQEGSGEAQDWIAKSVQKDLRELEILDHRFPEVLVTLSPLYQNEILTSEHYLINNFKINIEVINKLIIRGEINRQTCGVSDVLYGLPHSTLAQVYWKAGSIYRRRLNLPEHEDFIYDYALSDSPNNLRSLVSTEIKGDVKLIEKLEKDNKIIQALKNEKSMVAWALCIAHSSNGAYYLNDSHFQIILKERLQNHPDFINSVRSFILSVCKGMPVSEEMRNQFIETINLAKTINRVGHAFSLLSKSGEKVINTIQPEIDINILAQKLANSKEDIITVFHMLYNFWRVSSNQFLELWEKIPRKKLFNALIKVDSRILFLDGLWDIVTINKYCKSNILKELDNEKLATRLSNSPDDFLSFLTAIEPVDPSYVRIICNAIDIKSIAEKMLVHEIPIKGQMLYGILDEIEPEQAENFHHCIVSRDLVQELKDSGTLEEVINIILPENGYPYSTIISIEELQ